MDVAAGPGGPLPRIISDISGTRRSSGRFLTEAPDDAAATGGLALLAFPVIDLKGMLEIAELAGGLAMIAQRRAAGLDRLD